MNDPSSLRRLCPVPNGPLPHLICPRCKEAAKIEHFPHGCNNFGQCGFCTQLFAFLRCLLLSLETCKALLKRDGERQYRIARCMLFNPFGDLRKMFVFLADVVLLAKIDKVDNGLSAKEEERIDDFNLIEYSN